MKRDHVNAASFAGVVDDMSKVRGDVSPVETEKVTILDDRCRASIAPAIFPLRADPDREPLRLN